MPPSAPTTTDALIDLIRDSRLLPDATAEQILADARSLPPDPVHAATALVRQGVLTQFQARMLLSGKFRGFRLGDYLVQDQIGQGGMGTVYLARHQTLGRNVAIKVLPAAAAADKVALERFLREARTAAALDHPNVVKLYDVCKQGEIRYLVMEYVQGQTLDALVQAGGIAPGRAVGYIAQAAAGLQHAFERGFIHRDIKPANLILMPDDSVKILDMGLARSVAGGDNLTEAFDHGAVVGTADYVSPEQAMNLPGVDIRADIYSLGVTFYALVTGRPPFAGSTASKLVQHQLKEAPSIAQLDKTFPPQLAAVVSKMMAKRPEDRYATPADVIVALHPWLAESANLTAAFSRTEEGNGRLSSRNLLAASEELPKKKPAIPMWLLAGVLVVAAIGVGVAAVLLLNGDKTVAKGTSPVAPPPTEPGTPATTPVVTRPTRSTPATKPAPPKREWTDGKPLYTLDLTGQQPFELVTGMDAVKTKTGPGELPPNWSLKAWVAGHEVKGFAEETPGGPALGTKAIRGNGILLSPDLRLSGPHVKVKFEYLSSANGKNLLRFREVKDKPATETENRDVPPVADWTPYEVVFETNGMTGCRIEFHNSDTSPMAEFRFRNFQLLATEPK